MPPLGAFFCAVLEVRTLDADAARVPGPQASATTKRLLPVGTRVRLLPEPATDCVDDYGRLLRYVMSARDGVNVKPRLSVAG